MFQFVAIPVVIDLTARAWRDLMGPARDLARDLAQTGEVEVTQRGAALDPAAAWHGPIRIRIR